MKKTKIICTMGPNTNDRELMKQLALNGMDVARFNFSHGDYEEHMGRFKILESVREELGLPIAALLGTRDSNRKLKGRKEGYSERGRRLYADHRGDGRRSYERFYQLCRSSGRRKARKPDPHRRRPD